MIALPFAFTKTVQMWLWAGAAVAVAAFVYSYIEGERDQREARVRGDIAETTREAGQAIEEQTDEIFSRTDTDRTLERLRERQFAVGGLPLPHPTAPRLDGGGSGPAGDGADGAAERPRDGRPDDPDPGGERIHGAERGEPGGQSIFGVGLCDTIRARIMKDTAAFAEGCTK